MVKTSKKRKEKRQSAARRRAEQHRTGYDRTTLKVSSDVNFFSLQKEGTVRVDIIPYTVGKGNPFADEGQLHFERTYWAHRGVGANKDMYVCPARTAKKPCPVCEYRAKLAKDPEADEEEVRDLAPKERQLWNVIDLSDKDKGVQVWDISFHLFGKALDERIKHADEDDEFDFFYELKTDEGGRALKLGIGENSYAGNKFYEVSTIDFKVRKSDYDEEILEEAHNLDELLMIPEYDKLKALFMEAEQPEEDEEEDEEGEEEKPEKKTKAKKEKPTASEFVEGDEVEHEEFGTCKILRVSGDGTSLTLEDEDGDKHRAVSVDDVEKVEKTKKTKKKKEPEPEEEDEDEDDDWQDEDEEEEEEKPKKKTKVKEKESKSKKTKKKSDEDDEDDDDWD